MAIATRAATGSRSSVAIGEEVVEGTPVAPTHVLDFTSEGLTNSEETLLSESIRGDRGRHFLIKGAEDPQGDLNFEVGAEGYGMIFKHALGDYLAVNAADGGYHARTVEDTEDAIAATGAANDANDVLVLGDETSSNFAAAGEVVAIYRDPTTDALTAATGLEYVDINMFGISYITLVQTSATADTVSCTTVAVAPVNGDPIDFNSGGGVLEIGPNRTQVKYFHAVNAAGTVTFALEPGAGTRQAVAASGVLSDGTTATAGQIVRVLSCVSAVDSGDLDSWAYAKGTWLLKYDATNLTEVWTHFFQRGKRLPVGMTVEVDRDAAIFTYSGTKVGTLAFTFEAKSIVTAVASLVALKEYAMAVLTADAVPGSTSITVRSEEVGHWPTAGTITIGERTGITYASKTVNGDGTTTLGGIPGSGTAAIDRVHLIGSNVDLRTSPRVANPQSNNYTPLTTFESTAFINGFYEEALMASVTLNNNLNTDKFGLGSRQRLATIEERAEVEGELGLEFDDGKNYVKFQEGEFFFLELKAIADAFDAEIGDSDVPRQLYILCPKCKYNGETPVVGGESYIEHTMPFTGIVDDVNLTTDMTIITVNGNQYDVEAP